MRSTYWLLLGATLLVAACSTNRLEDEWAVTLEGMEGQPLDVMDVLPALDTVGINQQFSPYVLLSRHVLGDADRHRARRGRHVARPCSRRPSGAVSVGG